MELEKAQIPTLSTFEAALPELRTELDAWAQETIDEATDPDITGVPEGVGGSIFNLGNPISSKQVVRSSAIVQKHLGFRIPPVIIRKGGYVSVESFTKHILNGLRKVVTGEIKCRPKKAKSMVQL
jgi:hypothetical protein